MLNSKPASLEEIAAFTAALSSTSDAIEQPSTAQQSKARDTTQPQNVPTNVKDNIPTSTSQSSYLSFNVSKSSVSTESARK